MRPIYGMYADLPPTQEGQRAKEVEILKGRIALGLASPERTKRREARLQFLLKKVQ